MHNFRELKIWIRAMDLTETVYRISEDFSHEEKWRLKSQIRRCVVSIPSNIAEGAGRNTNGEFKQFLGIANGSASELITQLLLAYRLGLISEEKIIPVVNEVEEIQRMMYVFSLNNLEKKT